MSASSALAGRLSRAGGPEAATVALVVLGLAARLVAARGAVVAPDEAVHLQIAGLPRVADVYRESLSSAHPPLFFLLLHCWRGVSDDLLALRALPAAFGAAAVWAAYRWAARLFGRSAGLATAVQVALLPSVVLLTAEVRGYGLLLLLVTASLAATEAAFREESRARLAAATVLAGLSLLTHYGAAWFVLALGTYGATRLGAESPGPRFVRAWLAGQAVLVLLAAFLYVSHVSRLRGGTIERAAQTDWLLASYFEPGRESSWRFLARQTGAVFTFAYSSRFAGRVGFLALAAAVAGAAARRERAGLLLAAPFVFTAAAALLTLYPYGGTRHSAHLLPFVCAGGGVALSRLSGGRPWVALALAAALLPAAFAVGW